MPRSGTTLVEQILSSHSFVKAGGEIGFWPNFINDRLLSAIATLPSRQLQEIGNLYVQTLKSIDKEALHVTDKMPANFAFLGLIHAIFPQARFIHCRRNPLDTCLSIYFQKFSGTHPYAYDLKDLVFFYRQYVKLMNHWRCILPADRLYEISYEDLISDQEFHSRQLISFVGLEWEEACLNFHKTDRIVRTASSWQVRQGLYRTSLERWRNYERHLGALVQLM